MMNGCNRDALLSSATHIAKAWRSSHGAVVLTLSYASCGDKTPEMLTGLLGEPKAGVEGLLGRELLLTVPSGAADVSDASGAPCCCSFW